ncbi:MAG: polysaccharide deacetylase family protein [Planctomycetaceae bacterium]|nr:polysaccharide deacetylase family protein [Planctomycetaceae bacterium]
MIMYCSFNRWAAGKTRCLTMSYDDGVTADRRLVEIFNRHGIRGSFHLNGGLLGRQGYLAPEEVAGLYTGHEISAHGYTHPLLSRLPESVLAQQMIDDRRSLEALAGYPVRGMSYPYGDYSPRVIELLPSLGIEYARTVAAHGGFHIPENLLAWHPTCHHGDARLSDLTKRFVESQPGMLQTLFYVWGHSYEFNNADNWDLIENFCKSVAGDSHTWYATNIEVADYLNAQRALRATADGKRLFNPSAVSVWVDVGGQAVEVAPGKVTPLTD